MTKKNNLENFIIILGVLDALFAMLDILDFVIFNVFQFKGVTHNLLVKAISCFNFVNFN